MPEILPRNEQSESTKNLYDALDLAEDEFERILKTSDNPYFRSKYANLVTVQEAIKPALKKHKLKLQPFSYSDGDRAGTILRLIHLPSQEYIQTFNVAPGKGAGKDGAEKINIQTFGSVWTYTRRYSVLDLLDLATEDDDGSRGSGYEEEPPPTRTVSSAPAQDLGSRPQNGQTQPKRGRPPKATSPLPANSSDFQAGDGDLPNALWPEGEGPNSKTNNPNELVFSDDGKLKEPYRTRATKLMDNLASGKPSLQASADPPLSAGQKFIRYLLVAAELKDKKELTATKFENAVKAVEVLVAHETTRAKAISLIESAKEK